MALNLSLLGLRKAVEKPWPVAASCWLPVAEMGLSVFCSTGRTGALTR